MIAFPPKQTYEEYQFLELSDVELADRECRRVKHYFFIEADIKSSLGVNVSGNRYGKKYCIASNESGVG
jgi:hypothetical protein